MADTHQIKTLKFRSSINFDADEKLLTNINNKKILHPFISFVLHVTGGDNNVPTIELNQKATTKDNNNNNDDDDSNNKVLGDRLWHNKPINNIFKHK